MKKILSLIIVIFVGLISFYLAYDYKNTKSPNTYYKIYLNDEIIGVVQSKENLLKYIDTESKLIKEKYNVTEVLKPNGLVIEELTSYKQKVDEIEEIYKKIIQKSDLTIEGYQVTIKKDEKNQILYVTKEEILKTAITDFIKTFIGSDRYDAYINKSQKDINKTGTIIENIYIQNDITIKKTNIPINEKIFVTSSELSSYLLYGDNTDTRDYIVKLGDTISSVALANQISAEEFLIANTSFTDKTNLLHIGEIVKIIVPNPQIQVVVEEFQVLDKDSAFKTEERYDSSLYVGTSKVAQEGRSGIVRVSQNVQSINGSITYIEPVSREEIKQPISKIVLLGSQPIPNVGDLHNWAWPTLSGYTITDDFEWRTNPITGKREHHSGIDISGTGYGSPIYAANNGTIVTKKIQNDYGYYITINHNNGYWTLYAHMSRFANVNVGDTVMRGQIIGYMGSTGWATGPHLHFELWKNCDHCRVDPFSIYR